MPTKPKPSMDRPSWTAPRFYEIKMDAEIGSYELDDGERDGREPFSEER